MYKITDDIGSAKNLDYENTMSDVEVTIFNFKFPSAHNMLVCFIYYLFDIRFPVKAGDDMFRRIT